MKRVLVTGATGFIGQHCLDRLIELGYEVHAVSSKPQESQTAVFWHCANLLEAGCVERLIQTVKPSHLMHFAWSVVPGEWMSMAADVHFRWVQATLELIRSFHEAGGQRAVMAGSCAEYDWSYGYCSESITPLVPSTFYGVSKRTVQYVIDAYSNLAELNTAWGRVFFIYGPNEKPTRLVASVIRSLLLREKALCTHGNQVRDFLYVEDVADAFVSLLGSDTTGAVNIASGEPIRLKDLVLKIAEKLNSVPLVGLGAVEAREGEAKFVVGDVTRLSNEIGWAPSFSLDEGLDKTIHWWRQVLSSGSID